MTPRFVGRSKGDSYEEMADMLTPVDKSELEMTFYYN